MQYAAKEEFGLADSKVDHFDLPEAQIKADIEENKIGYSAQRAFLREMYNQTQAKFKEDGVEWVDLYRGATLPDFFQDGSPYEKRNVREHELDRYGERLKPFTDTSKRPTCKSAIAKVHTQPISSFSYDPETAKNFACAEFSSVAIGGRVPVSRILSIASKTGFGCKAEGEMTLLGGEDEWTAVDLAGPEKTSIYPEAIVQMMNNDEPLPVIPLVKNG
jgi:hypothetical protein